MAASVSKTCLVRFIIPRFAHRTRHPRKSVIETTLAYLIRSAFFTDDELASFRRSGALPKADISFLKNRPKMYIKQSYIF